MAVAKGIGGGFPLGAFLVTREAGKGMVVGTHGTTYGGNPLATRIGDAVLDVILAPGFLAHVAAIGLKLKQGLLALRDAHPEVIADIRGVGLMLGIVLRVPVADFAAAARAERILLIPAGDNVARVLPPLIIGDEEVVEGIKRLDAVCARFERKDAAILSEATG
jgi:acetylornithine/N-succinyldiaminopimelate aminotransferase